jgi:hypothetical protein
MRVAVVPADVTSVVTVTGPAGVVSASKPGPCRSARATAVAMVACPQKATSACGLK